MKFRLLTLLSVLFLSFSLKVSAQSEIIDKVFKDKGADFKSQIILEDTIAMDYFYASEDYGSVYSVKFGHEDFQHFITYRNKLTNKVGLIVYGTSVSGYSDAVADSIYFLQNGETESSEFYDDLGNYVFNTVVKSAQFYFDYNNTQDEYWTVNTVPGKYEVKKSGNLEKDLFKAVSFVEHITPEGYSYVTAIYANLRTGKIYNSTVLNQKVTANEVYAYHYDYYGEYDYYYSYEMPETDYSIPYFETRMNYEPIELVYIKSGDTIGDVMSYSYPEADQMAYYHKAVPENMNGVWSATDESGSLLILDGDDLWSAYGVFIATIDSYKQLYEVGIKDWNDAIGKFNLSSEDKSRLESEWKGSKNGLNVIGMTAFTTLQRFKDYYIFNDQTLAHIYLELDAEGNLLTGLELFKSEKVFTDYGFAKYDNYTYATVLEDLNGEPVDLYSAGVEYYYNYNLGVADRNIDKEGNLVLTTESLGNLQFKAFSGGSNYIGKVKYQWIGSNEFNSESKVVSIKSLPYKIVDQNGQVLADDVFSMYTTNVQGFNLYQIYDSNNKAGVLGPDGSWMLKREWDNVTVAGPSASYGYDGYGSIGLPVFFLVMKDEKYGALDSKGNWVVPMGYDFIEVCSEQLLANKNGKITIYSFDGKMLIENIDGFAGGYYGYATDCYSFDNTASGSRVLVKNDKYGIVDDNFKTVVPFDYTSIAPIGNGRTFIVSNADNKYGMITEKNEMLLNFEYDVIVPFDYNSERLIAGKDGKQGVIDTKGNVLIPFMFYSITSSSDWYSNMIYVSDPDYMTNIVDTTGKSLIDASCSYLYYYPSYQIFYCSTNDGQFDFYNIEGAKIFSKVASYIDPYSSYDYVQIAQMGDYENPLFGAFDLTSGADLMAYEFESLYPFWISDQSFFAATKNGKLGIYSINGTLLVKHKGMYLDNYFYESGEYGGEYGFFVEISNKKGKSKLYKLDW